ncbi:hypothetical protein [Nocardiopsis eucommiae]|uniref:hypothetical protein n=1 Tax=Nocardiopsis eucommiae TaxID=2831970 RepID=UPI003D72B677
MAINITTHGILRGSPPAAPNSVRVDLTVALRNPADDPRMIELTGLDARVRDHASDFTTDPEVSAVTMRRPAEFASLGQHASLNIGAAAGQPVSHLHAHVWSCTGSDMPWEPKQPRL